MSVISSVWFTGGGGGEPTGDAGGDLSGTYPDPTVASVGGKSAAAIGAAVLPSSTVPYWSPLKAAASPHASSDYFDDASLTGWSTWNPGATTLTVTETAATRLKVQQASHAGASHAGIYKAVPADTRYAITVDIDMMGRYVQYLEGGIFVAEDISGSPTTASMLLLNFQFNLNGAFAFCQSWQKYDTYTANHTTQANGIPRGPCRLGRLYVDTVANTYRGLISNDGRVWASITDDIAQASTQITGDPVYMGLCVSATATTDACALFSNMFRVDATSDPFLPIGGYVSLGVV